MENKIQEEFGWAEHKTCTKCKEDRLLTMFYWGVKDKYRKSVCIPCISEYDKQRYRIDIVKSRERSIIDSRNRRERNNLFILDHKKDNPCTECGERDPLVLDFDHKDPSTKRFNIADSGAGKYSISVIQTEIDKCHMLCANCHRRKTAKDRRYFAFRVLHEGYTPYQFNAEMVE
jgi:5-methylcytosine-specific restriction endonuclease McrA